MIEEWKDIKSPYQISNLGRLRNKNTSKILKTKINNSYEYNSSVGYIHRLVAQAFIPNKECLPQVNHIDENKLNNKVDNLEWCTCSYNVKQAKHKMVFSRERLPKEVIMFDLLDNKIMEFKSIKEASRYLNKPAGRKYISLCCKGLKDTAYGYKWKFRENIN